MGVSGLHAGKALVCLGRMTPLEAEAMRDRAERGTRWRTMVEEDCGEELWALGASLPQHRLDRDSCTKPLGAPGEVRAGEGLCVWWERASFMFLRLQSLWEKKRERGNIRRFTPEET